MGLGQEDSIPRMADDAPETRTLIHLRTGSKICVMVALCLIAVAVYFYFVPVSVMKDSGGVFQCGSAAEPPTSTFNKNVCAGITDVNLYRTFLFAAMAVVTAALGCWFFGVDRTVEERQPRSTDDADDAPRRPRPRRDDRYDAADGHEDDEDELPSRRSRSHRRPTSRHRYDDDDESDHDDDRYDDESLEDELPSRRRSGAGRERRRSSVDLDD